MHEYWITYEWQGHGQRGAGDAGIRQATPLKSSEISTTKDSLAATLAPRLGFRPSIIILSIYKFEQEV